MRRLLLTIGLFLIGVLPVHAADLFDSDFEGGGCVVDAVNTNAPCNNWRFFNDSASLKSLVVKSGAGVTGTQFIRGTWNNVNGSTSQPSMYHDMNGATHFFVRFAVRQTSGFKVGSNNLTKLFRITTAKASTDQGSAFPFMYPTLHVMMQGSPPNWIVAMEQPYTSPTQAGGSGLYGAGGTPFWRNGPPITQNAWDIVELEIQLNTPGQSNGLMNLWVNGTIRISQTGMAYVGPTSTSRNGQGYLNSSAWTPDTAQFFVQSGNGTIDIDRVAVCSTRCSVISGGVQPPPTQDTTPPSPPTNVTVQ